MDGTVSTRRNARVELQTWYLASLEPKLARAAAADVVPSASAEALDRQLREFLDLPGEAEPDSTEMRDPRGVRLGRQDAARRRRSGRGPAADTVTWSAPSGCRARQGPEPGREAA